MYPRSFVSSIEEHNETIFAVFPTVQLKTIFSVLSHNDPRCNCNVFGPDAAVTAARHTNTPATRIKRCLFNLNDPALHQLLDHA
jgi:hypothetical protein